MKASIDSVVRHDADLDPESGQEIVGEIAKDSATATAREHIGANQSTSGECADERPKLRPM